jgi:hypothetical protein
MGAPLIREVSTPWGAIPTHRKFYWLRSGFHGDFSTPEGYVMAKCSSSHHFLDAPNSFSPQEFGGSGGIPSWSQPAANAAYEEFREEALGDQAAVGVAIAEWKQSLGMITKRGIQLASAANNFRRGRVAEGLQTLGVGGRGRRRPRDNAASDAANLWLEYSFGWKPLYQDIYDAADELSGDTLPSGKAHGSSGTTHSWTPDANHSYKSNVRHRVGAIVKLSNPNLYLASQMGLVNPASIGWELVPYSFVVDWMFDVGSFIDSFTDFFGCSVEKPWSAHYCTYVDTYDTGVFTFTGTGTAAIRGGSLIRPVPNWEVRANLGNSLTRAANATALAIQSLNRLGSG